MKEESGGIFQLDGRVPLLQAIPFGLQHVLAMFVSNIAPILIIAQVAVYDGKTFSPADITMLVQNCMLIAGIGTLIQLYPVWKIGSRLPVVMGVSFTFLSSCLIAASMDYGYMIGAVIIGGCMEGTLGLLAKYWRSFVKPIVSACVVTTIGLSLLSVGVSSLSQSAAYPIGDLHNIAVGLLSLLACLLFSHYAKGFYKQLSVLFGLIVGYVAAILLGMIDFSSVGKTIAEAGIVNFPRIFYYHPKFSIGTIIPICLVFLVSAAETIGDTTAICTGGLGRDITAKEVSGSLACDGFISAVSGGVFGLSPITSFSQNVGLVAMTKVVNRFTIMTGAMVLLLAGFFPPIGAVLSTVPSCVLGGCTVMMFGSILVSGVKMLYATDLEKRRNTVIAATSLSVGIGVTEAEGFFNGMPAIVGEIFGANAVAGVFVLSMILSLILPEDKAQEE